MASKDKKYLSKMEYVTDHRTATLASHLDRYLRWGFHNDDDPRFSDILVQVESNHHSDMREYVGHQEDRGADKLEYARSGRQIEHGVERDMLTNVQRNKFRSEDPNFNSDDNKQNHAIIRITLAEAPRHPDYIPGTAIAGKDKDGNPKDVKAEVDKIKNMITKEVKTEVGDDITNLDVEARTQVGNKIISRLTYHDEPVKAKYQFAVFVISFTWNDNPGVELKDTKLNYQHKVGKNSPLLEEKTLNIKEEIKTAANLFNMSIADFITLLDNELQ